MTVRHKMTLLITAVGFISSLLFSGIIMWEMIEQPFHLIDADLESTAKRAVQLAFRSDEKQGPRAQWPIYEERYWLEIKDQDSGKSVYRSNMAKLIKIPEPSPGSSATISLIISPEKINLGQNRQNKVTFRVWKSEILLGEKRFLVCAGRPIEHLTEEIWETLSGVVGGLIFSGLLLMASSYFLAGFILKPIKIMNQQAVDISAKYLDRRLPVSDGRDEFNALAITLNQVFDRLQHAFLRQKRLLADTSHELKTPLTMMRLALDKIRSDLDETHPDPQAESHEWMTEQVLRMERLVRGLLDLSALEIEAVAAQNSIDLTKILTALILDYRLMAELRNIRISVNLPKQLRIEGDEEKLNRAFSNILDNAVKYSIDGGQIEITGVHFDSALVITISNLGQGVNETKIPKVFDQFYRVEQSRSLRYGGSGLGLAIVERIVGLHGGNVKFESRQGSWTRVTVGLPRHRGKIPV
jgi:two-component system, OmpR family, sensor kinase